MDLAEPPVSPDFGADTGLLTGLFAGLELPPALTPSQWAAAEFMLSSEGSAEPGRFNPDRAPYQAEMMDAAFEPGVHTITMKTSAQVGKTTVLLVIIGYGAVRHPAPMLLVQPTQDMARAFAEERLEPAIRDVPAMSRVFPPPSSRGRANTLFYKKFPAGYIAMVGANNPVKLRMRAVKYGLADEVDAYEHSATKEGDPLELLEKRMTTFWDRKFLRASTPLIKERSRISRAYEESDQRKFMVPCPQCREFQALEWKFEEGGGLDPLNIKWEPGKEDEAYYICEHCGAPLTDLEIKRAVRHGHWRAHAPFNGHAGFWIWELYSPWSSLGKIVRAYEKAKGFADRLQTFVNTVLGLEWSGNVIGAIQVAKLLARREPYPEFEMPDRAALLTAGVDVQHDRLELQVMAWGMDDERWLMSHRQIMGDPNSPAVWAALEEQLLRGYSTRNGHVMGIEVAAIDSGGLHTQKVYDFCAVHILTGGRLWWPIKGQGGQGVPIWRRSELSVRTGVKLIIIGVDDAKVGVYSALHVTQTSSTPEGPNYFHLPLRPDDQRVGVGVVDQLEKGMFLDEPAIKRLTAEKLIQVQDERGFSKLEWHKPEGARNEELDCAAYNLAARRSLAVDMGARLERLSRPPEIALDPVAIARKFKR